jgi:riboflavin synthase alpha subunit
VEKGSITIDGVSLTVATVGSSAAEMLADAALADAVLPDAVLPDAVLADAVPSGGAPPVGGITFSVSLIPTTLALTTLGHKGIGAPVNLEVDVIAKYVEKLLDSRSQGTASGTAEGRE